MHFSNLAQMLNILEKNITLLAYLFRILRTAKVVVTQMSKISLFRRPFHKQHGKRSKTLLKYVRQHLYPIY